NDAEKDTATLEKLISERRSIVEEYEALTKTWIAEKPEANGTREAAPTQNGSTEIPKTNLTETLKKRNALAEKLKASYWSMDKHLRAKTIYDRVGIIKEGGIIDDYAYRNVKKLSDTVVTTPAPAPAPTTSAVAAEKKANATVPVQTSELDID